MCCGRKKVKKRKTTGPRSGLTKSRAKVQSQEKLKKDDQHPPNQQ
jgi:hypothetical protein